MRTFLTYTRVSTAIQDTNTSISRQAEACERWGKDQGWTLVEWIHDTQTGKSYGERAGIQKVLDLVESGRVTDVVCYSVDRTGREALVIQSFFKDIYLRGGRVTLITKSKTYPTFNSIKKDTLFDVAVAEWERTQIEDRMSQGKMFAFKELKSYIYSPSYGYDIKSRQVLHNGHKVKYTYLVINESEAAMVRVACEKFVECKNLGETSRYLNDIGIKAKKNGKFGTTQLNQLLTRVIMYSGQEREEVYMGESRMVSYPAIISPELAQQVLLTLQVVSKKQTGSSTATPPFTKLITCANCGRVGVANMGWHKGNSAKFGFICQTFRTERNDKQKSGVSATAVSTCRSQVAYKVFHDALITFLDTVDVEGIETQYEFELSKLVTGVKHLQLQIDAKTDEREALKAKQRALVDASIKLAGDENFAAMVGAYSEHVKDIQQQLDSIDKLIRQNKKLLESRVKVFDSLGISLEDIDKFIIKPIATTFKLSDIKSIGKKISESYQDKSKTRGRLTEDAAKQAFEAFIKAEALKVRDTLTQLRADLEAEEFERVNLTMVKLGLHFSIDFSESDRKARNQTVGVLVDFEPLENMLSASDTGKPSKSTNGTLYL
ncbi:recombinase family protein [Deinococcus aquaticus]|uniref:Recombinase family protein n=1 Tax=Deinococcus aquaticus TaxID=328692 RepID=A0ABY7V1Z9_9DEIO|nr:recombinase family protein [Deinococcus aquaticus]WDA58148.1 recombinase family protein [Deinococcus aquaticus]